MLEDWLQFCRFICFSCQFSSFQKIILIVLHLFKNLELFTITKIAIRQQTSKFDLEHSQSKFRIRNNLNELSGFWKAFSNFAVRQIVVGKVFKIKKERLNQFFFLSMLLAAFLSQRIFHLSIIKRFQPKMTFKTR